VVASFLFNMSGGRLAFLTSVSSASEYKSKPARNVHLSKIKGIISLKQKKSNFTTKMFGVQSHKKTVSTDIAYRFWLCSMYQRTPPAVYYDNIFI